LRSKRTSESELAPACSTRRGSKPSSGMASMAARSTSRRRALPSGLPRTDRSMSATHAASKWAFSSEKEPNDGTGTRKFRRPKPTRLFDMALLVSPGHPAEVVGEQEVAF